MHFTLLGSWGLLHVTRIRSASVQPHVNMVDPRHARANVTDGAHSQKQSSKHLQMFRLQRMEVLNSKTQNIYPKRLIKHEQQGFKEASPSNSLHEMPSVLNQQWPGRGFNCQRSKVCVSLNGEYTPLARLAKHRLHAHGSTTTIR